VLTTAEYDRLTESLRARLEGDARVLALVALGSTAVPERRDHYSDHDFWVVVTPGSRMALLEGVSWLPDVENLVSSTRTGARYLVGLYVTGHVIELGIFEPEELSEGKLGAYRILFDRHGIEEQLAEIAKRSSGRPPTPDEHSECELLFVTLLTGATRAARGEQLSAHKYIRYFAPDFLIGLLVRSKPSAHGELIDPLDAWRHFDQLDPAVAADLRAAVRLPAIEAALCLLEIAERELRAAIPDYPASAAAVVRSALQRLSRVEPLRQVDVPGEGYSLPEGVERGTVCTGETAERPSWGIERVERGPGHTQQPAAGAIGVPEITQQPLGVGGEAEQLSDPGSTGGA
jgi:hypothetical protein